VRNRLRGLMPKEIPENIFQETVQWTVGEDMPLSFDKETLYKEAKKTIYLNYRRGAITKEEKNMMMQRLKKLTTETKPSLWNRSAPQGNASRPNHKLIYFHINEYIVSESYTRDEIFEKAKHRFPQINKGQIRKAVAVAFSIHKSHRVNRYINGKPVWKVAVPDKETGIVRWVPFIRPVHNVPFGPGYRNPCSFIEVKEPGTPGTWRCICHYCGNMVEYTKSQILSTETISCGCYRKKVGEYAEKLKISAIEACAKLSKIQGHRKAIPKLEGGS